MLNDESGKAKGYLSLHYGCDPVNGKLGLELSFDILPVINDEDSSRVTP
jgi:hypothetical protein